MHLHRALLGALLPMGYKLEKVISNPFGIGQDSITVGLSFYDI